MSKLLISRTTSLVTLTVLMAFAKVIMAANPVPYLNNPLAPTSTSPGAAAFTLTLHGANFVSGATVYWNGSPRATQFISATKLTATILAADVAVATTAAVAIGNPGTPALSNVRYFSVGKPRSVATAPLTFALTSQQWAPDIYSYVAAADFNGDGNVDLAGLDTYESTLTILLGNGDGTFQTPISYPVSNAATIAVGDFNNDGKLDLALQEVIQPDSNITILLGNGDGTFVAQPTSFPAGMHGHLFLRAGDFNRDGNLDLVSSNTDNQADDISIFLGNGDGTFQPYQNIQIAQFTLLDLADVAVGDFNQDGKLDLATFLQPTQSYPATFYVLLGKGDGSFAPPITVTPMEEPEAFAFGDVNGDGIPDAIVLTNEFDYFRGVGNGTFRSEGIFTTYSAVSAITLADLNADNKLDIVSSNLFGGATILMNENGGFGPSVALPFDAFPDETITVADFNNDGRPDLVVSNLGVYLSRDTTLLPSSLAFPPGKVGIPDPPQTLTIQNMGPTGIDLTNFIFTGVYPLDFSQTNDCGGVVPAQSSCRITVTFVATSGGDRSAYLNVEEGANGTQTVALTGFADGQAPVVRLSGNQLNWGSVPVGQPGTAAQVQLTNIGGLTLKSLSISVTGTNTSDFAVTGNTCRPTEGPGASCLITVVFTPTADGSRSAALTFTDNAYSSPQTVALSGTGI